MALNNAFLESSALLITEPIDDLPCTNNHYQRPLGRVMTRLSEVQWLRAGGHRRRPLTHEL
jgi:hypothetical protein